MLRIKRIALAFRIEKRIGQSIIHRAQPGRARISGECRLNRRRFSGKNEQTIPRRMQGQIHQDVNSVASDHLGDKLIGDTVNLPPAIGQRLKSPAILVGFSRIGVAINLEPARIALAKKRQDISADDVILQVR